jgi:hypothetical protein
MATLRRRRRRRKTGRKPASTNCEESGRGAG